MFVDDIRSDFYNVLLGNRVLLLVHYDVDAICACKILQNLFKCDNISYTLVPVGGISELKSAYEENNEEIKYVVLVNCGGTIDLVDILQPDEHVVFFVLDSHKPSDVCNVYSDGQVRLVYKDSEENIPNFEDIFRDDDEQNDDAEEEEGGSGREELEAVLERRRERRAWEEKRNTLMFNYTQFSYYGKPSACVALEVAWRLSRVASSVVWSAAVSLAAHDALAARASAECLLDADRLRRHLLNNTNAHAAEVILEKDAWLPLYRVWSLESALKHSPALGPHLKLYSLAGAAKVRQLLADMGFPLQQARQSYRSMDVDLRKSLLTSLEASTPKHKLPVPTRAAFLLRRPHSPTLAALDLVFAIIALLEHETIPRVEGFQRALSALDTASGNNEHREKGLEGARRALQSVASMVHSALQARLVRLAGPFRYLIVPEGAPEAKVMRGPLWLGVAARWAASSIGGNRPLLASAHIDEKHCLLIGVPPRHEQEPRNLFGAAFEQAAARSGVSVSLDYFDSSVVALPISQRAQFLDALTALLA